MLALVHGYTIQHMQPYFNTELDQTGLQCLLLLKALHCSRIENHSKPVALSIFASLTLLFSWPSALLFFPSFNFLSTLSICENSGLSSCDLTL